MNLLNSHDFVILANVKNGAGTRPSPYSFKTGRCCDPNEPVYNLPSHVPAEEVRQRLRTINAPVYV